MFHDDANVLFFSIHRYDHGQFYPQNKLGGSQNVGGLQGYTQSSKINKTKEKKKNVYDSPSSSSSSSSVGGPRSPLSTPPSPMDETSESMPTTINVAFDGGNERMGDEEYRAAWNYVLIPACKQFKPDIIFISAGFDAARGDPIGFQHLSSFLFSSLRISSFLFSSLRISSLRISSLRISSFPFPSFPFSSLPFSSHLISSLLFPSHLT